MFTGWLNGVIKATEQPRATAKARGCGSMPKFFAAESARGIIMMGAMGPLINWVRSIEMITKKAATINGETGPSQLRSEVVTPAANPVSRRAMVNGHIPAIKKMAFHSMR